jgi:Uma2 family endonuclease
MELEEFTHLAEQAQEAGIKIELSAGRGTWEAFPGLRHQKALVRIEHSIEAQTADGTRSRCGCFAVPDTYIRLPDGSLKRPDLAVFCHEPPDIDEAYDVVPGAVIEIVSKDYEEKDFTDNPPLYLKNGVLDVVIFDPRTKQVHHHRKDGMTEHVSPVTLDLQMGCRITV